MNAQSTIRQEVAKAPTGSGLLSRLDLSDHEGAREALWRLRRCETDADFAGWARTYADPIVALLEREPPKRDGDDL